MKYRTYLFVISMLFAFAALAAAQRPVRFTSAYTSLDKGCKTLRGGPGQDNAFICKGVGGYKVRIYYSAAASHITAERAGSDDNSPIAMLNIDADLRRSKLEWRLANGKPFAVIIRVPKYEEAPAGEYFGKVIGWQLIIIGIGGYDIDDKVDANTPRANIKAREIAASGFVKKP